MKRKYFCGFNGFQQFGLAHASKVLSPTEFFINNIEEDFLCTFSWAFNVFAVKNELIIQGFVGGEPDNCIVRKTEHPIKKIASNDNYCLVLLENGDVFKLNIRNATLEKLEFLQVEMPRKRSVFGELKKEIADEVIHLACNIAICIAITRNNAVYNIPSKIYEFPKHVKIKQLVCGFEHALILTANGDVYSCGNGLRGQLGLIDTGVQETPTLIEALAGVKIVNIATGGWHSVAISAFGDIYAWGSNVNGQLGIKVYKEVNLGKEMEILNRKNPTIYHLPQLIDDWPCCTSEDEEDCSPVRVVCGARHTFVQNSCGKIFCTGWNEHGQLGLSSEESFKDKFVELDFLPSRTSVVLCGPWCTVMLT